MSVILTVSSMQDVLGFGLAMLCVPILNFATTFFLKWSFNCPSILQAFYWCTSIIDIPNLGNSLNWCNTPAGFSVLAKVASRTCIFLVKKTTDLLFAAGGTTMKDVALVTINILNSWFKKCIYRWCPLLLKSLFVLNVISLLMRRNQAFTHQALLRSFQIHFHSHLNCRSLLFPHHYHVRLHPLPQLQQ